MSLVVLGLANVWQIVMVQTGVGVPEAIRSIGSGSFVWILPNSLFVFVPLAALILVGLRRTGYGRLLYAVGDNPIAARLAGARGWQVLIVLYMISAVLAAIAGFLVAGLTNVASVTLVDSLVLPSVAAAVIGGTSIMGGRGGYSGHDRRGAHPDRASRRCCHRSAIRRPSARSCSARSSWPSRRPTRGSRRSPERRAGRPVALAATSGSTWAARTSSGPSSSTTDGDVAHARPRPGPVTPRRRAPTSVVAAPRGRRRRGASSGTRACASVGIGVPGLYDAARRDDTLPREPARRVGGPAGRRARRRRASGCRPC